MAETLPVDFALIVERLQAVYGSQGKAADHLGISRSTLRGYLDGSQPPHSVGCALIDAWCAATGTAAAFVPRQAARPLSAAQVERAAPATAKPSADSLAALSAITLSWRGAASAPAASAPAADHASDTPDATPNARGLSANA